MPTQFSTTDNVQGLFDSFLPPAQNEGIQEAQPSLVQQLFTPAPANASSSEESSEEVVQDGNENGGEEEKKKEEGQVNVQDALNKGKKEELEDKSLIKDVSKYASLLKEKGLLEEYEDGTLPENEDQVIDALAQSRALSVQKEIEEAWKAKVEALPESLVKIHEYASIGITTAQELNHYINSVAQQEAIGALDPKNPEDQEQIVLIQLLNTGIPEESARADVADLKERNKLEARAKDYFPALKKAYDDNVAQQILEKQRTQEELDRYIQTNGANVNYFLDKDTDYLPFKFATNDKAYKQAIAQLAAQPVEVTPEGLPVFGWQRQIEALQYGTEAEYKKYMKVMAFLANPDKYEEGVGKKASGDAKATTFKKIKDTSGKTNNSVTQEQQQPPAKAPQRQQGNSWSLT